MTDNINLDALRASTPEWQQLSAMEAQALHHEREAHRIRAEIRRRAAE